MPFQNHLLCLSDKYICLSDKYVLVTNILCLSDKLLCTYMIYIHTLMWEIMVGEESRQGEKQGKRARWEVPDLWADRPKDAESEEGSPWQTAGHKQNGAFQSLRGLAMQLLTCQNGKLAFYWDPLRPGPQVPRDNCSLQSSRTPFPGIITCMLDWGSEEGATCLLQ